MLVLLVISSIAAALVPIQQPVDPTTTPTAATPDPEPGGELRRRTIDAQAKRPQTVRVELGDQLALRVVSEGAGQVEIAALGELADVDAGAPARFDLLPSERGRYRVRMLEPSRTIGWIEVGRPRPGRAA
jgi:hypothetical protein